MAAPTDEKNNMMLDAVIEAASLISAVSTFSQNSAETEDGPPRMIHIPSSPLERSTPYAQLCYDPQQSTLVAIMENRRKGRRDVLPDSFPSMQGTITVATNSSSSSSSIISNASTFSLSTMTEQRVEGRESHLPFVLGSHPFESQEDENCLYLLHDCDTEQERKSGIGCAGAITKFVKSRPLRFLQVHKHQYPRQPLRERTVKHGYEPIQSQRSIKKWM
jgi:hypothetical protein